MPLAYTSTFVVTTQTAIASCDCPCSGGLDPIPVTVGEILLISVPPDLVASGQLLAEVVSASRYIGEPSANRWVYTLGIVSADQTPTKAQILCFGCQTETGVLEQRVTAVEGDVLVIEAQVVVLEEQVVVLEEQVVVLDVAVAALEVALEAHGHGYVPVDNFSELSAAITAGRDVEVREVITVASSFTIPVGTRVLVHDAGGFFVTGTAVLTMNGSPIGWGDYQQVFFGGSSGSTVPGQVVGSFDDSPRSINWFGAQTGSSFDSVSAINSALKAFTTGGAPVEVVVPAGQYYVGSEIDMSDPSNYGTVLRGHGRAASIIKALPAFAGTVFPSDEYTNGTMTIVRIGTTFPNYGSFGCTIRNLQFDGFEYAGGLRLSAIYQLFFSEEFFTIDQVTIQGYTGFGIGIGQDGETTATTRMDINGFHVTNCEIHYAKSHSLLDGSAIPVNVTGGRNFVMSNCTVFGYYDSNALATEWLPSVIKLRNSNFTISNIHTEGGIVVFDLYKKYYQSSTNQSQGGGNITSCDALRFGTHIQINDEGVALTVSQTRGSYDAARGMTSPPYTSINQLSPRFIYDIPAGTNSAGYSSRQWGTDLGIGFYSRIYQDSTNHPFAADPDYVTGTRVTTNHTELQLP